VYKFNLKNVGQDRLSVLKSNTMIINHSIKNGLRSIGNPI